jgi:hypothetical protein
MIRVFPLLAALASVPPSLPPPGAAALAASAVAGRLVVIEGSTPVSIQDVRRRLGGRPLGLQLRSGGTLIVTAVADDGLFVAELDSGEWIVEGISSGALFEFLAPPRQVDVRTREVACVGQLSVTFEDLGAGFGRAKGRWSSTADRCGDLAPRLKAMARGRSVRTRNAGEAAPPPPKRSGWEILAAMRTSVGWWFEGGEGSLGDTLTGTVTFGLNRPVTTRGAVALAASFTQASGGPLGYDSVTRRSVAAGLSYVPFGWLELMAGPELHLDAGGLGVFAQARLGTEGYAMYARVDMGGPGRVFLYGLEIAPAWFLGGFL